MIFKVLLLFLAVWTCRAYYTTVSYQYVWTTKAIDYYLWSEDANKIADLEALVNLTLSTLKKDVGPLITWKRVEPAVAKSKDRYVTFVFAKYACLDSSFATKGGSIIPLSNQNGCDVYTNIHNILRALGFVSPHLRVDRDDFIQIHFDNISPIDHQNHDKCTSCMTSEDPVFEKYDFESLLHPPKFNPFSIDYNKPIITEKHEKDNGLLKNSYKYSGRSLSANDIALFKAVYGKAKLDKNF